MHPLSWRARLLLPALLVGASAIVLLVRLDDPGRIVFDETYYVNDARAYLETGVEDSFAVHPPVGKWLIAAGIAVFGDRPFGWRVAGAVAGAVTVLLLYLLALRLFRRVAPAALATLLLAVDGLFIVQARTAMLDIFLSLFVVAAALLLVLDHDRNRLTGPAPPYPVPAGGSGDGPPPPRPTTVSWEDDAAILPRRSHGWRFAAGVALGLAIATKWSGLLALGAAGLLVLGWEGSWRRRWTGRWWVAWPRGVVAIAVPMVVVPAAVYVVSFASWFANVEDTYVAPDLCPQGTAGCEVPWSDRLSAWGGYHADVWRFHTQLDADHPYRAEAATWPVMNRPVVYYWETCPPNRAQQIPRTDPDTGAVTTPDPCVVAPGDAEEVLALGNPAVWWGFLAAAPLVVAGLGRGDPRAAVIVAFWAGQFLPWLVVSRPVFLFYMVPVVPFLALALGYAVATLLEGAPSGRALLAAAAGGALGWLGGLAAETAGLARGRWLGLAVIGAVAAFAAGLWWKEARRVTRVRSNPRRGWWTGIAVTVVAVAAFVYFLPVWTSVPLPEDAIRARWWLTSWI